MNNTENTILNYTLFAIIQILVFLVLFLVKRANKKAEKSMDENNFILREPKIYLWIGIICVLFFCGLIVIMCMFPNDRPEWWTYLVFALFGMLGFYIIFYCVRWKVEFTSKGFNILILRFKKERIYFEE